LKLNSAGTFLLPLQPCQHPTGDKQKQKSNNVINTVIMLFDALDMRHNILSLQFLGNEMPPNCAYAEEFLRNPINTEKFIFTAENQGLSKDCAYLG
jgi:hypothetical protein